MGADDQRRDKRVSSLPSVSQAPIKVLQQEAPRRPPPTSSDGKTERWNPAMLRSPHIAPPAHERERERERTPAAILQALDAPRPAPPFRARALRARSEERVLDPLPEVGGSGWLILLVLATLLAAALALAYFGRVEQTSIAHGALVVRGGPRPVLSMASGPVLALDVLPGQSVQEGQSLARIAATELNARAQRDAAMLALARAEQERIGAAELARLQAEQRALGAKRALLEERAALKAAAVQDRHERMTQIEEAAAVGVASQDDALHVREAERAASEELLLIRQQITETDLQLTDSQKNYDATQQRLRHETEAATSSLHETRALLETTVVRAPMAGRVESLLVTQGEVVSSGTVLARIVPEGAITSAVVFAPVKDASFLHEGLTASLEFASLPSSEFGKAPARVTRVSKDVASADETATLLGRASEEAVIRVELELLPSRELRRVRDKLRSGERLTARLNTRDRRMIALVFDFLRKWYEP